MSTKTLRKRIALVAVSALGFGLVSIVPASATAGNAATSTAGGTAQTVQADATFATTLTLGNLSSNTDTLDVKVTGPAGSTLTVTKVGTVTYSSSNTVSPTTAGAISGTALTLSEGSDNANWPGASSGVVALEGSINMPGVYTITAGATTTSTTTITVVAASSLTSTLLASTNNSGFAVVGGSNVVVTVSRNTGGALADGTILARVDATPDSDLTVGQILGNTAVTGVTAANSSASRQFTFAIATFATAGTYSLTFFNDTNANSALDSGEITTTGSFVVGAAAASTSLISASLSRTVGNSAAGVNTVTVTATITDADGGATTGALRVAETDSTGAAYVSAAANNSGAGFTTASNAIAGSGSLLTRVGTTNTYTGTFTIDASSTEADYTDTYLTVYIDGTIAATATTSAKKALRITKLGELTAVTGAPTVSVTDVAGIGSVTSGVRQSLSVANYTTLGLTVDKTVTSQTFTFGAAVGDEGEYLKVEVAPAGTTGSSVVAPVATLVAVGADLTAKYTVTTTAPAAADSYTLTVTDGSGDDVVVTITFATAAPAWSISPTANFKAKYGDTSTVTGTLSDQFGRVLADKAVYAVVTGRQAGTYTGKTAADGTFAFKWTDASASTTVVTDAVTLKYDYLATATSTANSTASSSTRTVTYSATGVAVGSVSVAAPTATNTRPIDMDASIGLPAATSRVTYTATVKDAAGLPVAAGALVTFTGGADDLFYGGSTGVTDEFGQASVVVYRTKVGAPAIKAEAGGITSAASPAIQWTNDVLDGDSTTAAPNASSAKRQARYISLKSDVASVVSAGVLRFTATVTDRFGNAVEGAQVTFAETGAGRFYNPPTSNQVTTNAAGEASIDLNSQAGETGTASVTAVITEATALQAINEDAAGYITNITETGGTFSSTLTAVAGVTAAVKSATATATIAKDTSTSTADALLALATALGTREKASEAVDAAAEATDAANAATDAANAAAEAADAATAAAQDAADAVAALSTQVSEMVAALKKQITSLTNLVIKIQKKVKA